MSGITASLANNYKQKEMGQASPLLPIMGKTSSTTMDRLAQSVYSYLNMRENPYTTSQSNQQTTVNAPWIKPSSTIFEWWIRVVYKGVEYQKQLDISINDFQKKFLKHPLYSQDTFFNVDDDPEDDLKVSFGFYWETILNSKTNHEYKSLEDLVRVRQINNGPSDLYAGLEVWSEIHVNWGLVQSSSVGSDISTQMNQAQPFQQKGGKILQAFVAFLTLLQQKIQASHLWNPVLFTHLFDNNRMDAQERFSQSQRTRTTRTLATDDDYFAVGVGYRTGIGERIPLYVEKRFAFAKENLFNPTIFQQVMKTDPSGTDPLELLYGFRAYNGSTNTLKYDIAFSVKFTPFVTMTTQFIPLGGYIYYHFDAESQHTSQTMITYASDIHVGSGDGVNLSLVFDKIDSTMAQSGRWMSFGLRRDPHGFDYEASNIFNVAVIIDSPWFSQKVRINGLPKTLSYEWKIFDDFEVSFVQGKLFYVHVRGYADLTMSSTIGQIIVYYPKLKNAEDSDVPFLTVSNIPSSRRIEASATLNIQNNSMLRIDANGYVDLTKSGALGDITVFYPKADPTDPSLVLMKVPGGNINDQRVSAEATLYVDMGNFSNINNYMYGKIQRQANSNFNELDFYLPNVTIPLVQITDIPANAYATGTFWWNQLKGFGRAERSSASSNPDPVHFNLVFDTLTLTDIFSIGDGHVQTDFQIAEDGYFKFDTSHDVLGNTFSVGNSATGNALSIGASTISAQNFEADWGVNTTTDQPQLEHLALAGTLDALNDFEVSIALAGETVDFTGDWSLGDSGGFSIDLQQDDDVRIDLIHLNNLSGRLDVNGFVILSNNLHYDMSWQWKQGSSIQDPGYFRINQGTNQPNLKTIKFDFVVKDPSSINRWGVDVNLTNFAVYVCVEWYYFAGFHVWPVVSVSGQLRMDVLLNYDWYHVWP